MRSCFCRALGRYSLILAVGFLGWRTHQDLKIFHPSNSLTTQRVALTTQRVDQRSTITRMAFLLDAQSPALCPLETEVKPR